MSIGRRILDGVNSVMGSLAADDTPLSHVDEARLRAELQARIDDRGDKPPDPRANPVAKYAGASAEAQREREKAAAAREGRVHRDRDAREKRARADQERAFREAQQRARTSGSSSRSTGPRPGGSQRRKSSSRRRPFGGGGSSKVAEYYKVLDLPVGSDMAAVKKQFRVLMRKYHPDRHGGNPKKQKAATELTMRVTQAYNELEAHLKNKS